GLWGRAQGGEVRAGGGWVEAGGRAEICDAGPRPALAPSGLMVVDIDRVERAKLDQLILPRLVLAAPHHHGARRILRPRDARELGDMSTLALIVELPGHEAAQVPRDRQRCDQAVADMRSNRLVWPNREPAEADHPRIKQCGRHDVEYNFHDGGLSLIVFVEHQRRFID